MAKKIQSKVKGAKKIVKAKSGKAAAISKRVSSSKTAKAKAKIAKAKPAKIKQAKIKGKTYKEKKMAGKATRSLSKDQKTKVITTKKVGRNLPSIKPYKASEGEAYMNPKQLEHFRNLLLHWKEDLLHGAESTVQDMQAKSANFPDPVDRASQEEEFSLELRARDRERKLLKKIEEALQRITENNYGYCIDCGADIGLRRLEARPTATLCIECKTISEIRERQIGEVGKEEE